MKPNIAGGNIDVIVFHKSNNVRYKITIIELKKGTVDGTAVAQTEQYAKWAAEHLANMDIEAIQIVLIGKTIKEDAKVRCRHYGLNKRPPKLVEYEVNNKAYRIDFSLVEF
ncbi:MAG: hypothetical protein Kow0090_18600 [Myxococcota bacterium]